MTPSVSAICESVADQLADMGLDCIVTVSDGESVAVNRRGTSRGSSTAPDPVAGRRGAAMRQAQFMSLLL